jgi:hypothetical protein
MPNDLPYHQIDQLETIQAATIRYVRAGTRSGRAVRHKNGSPIAASTSSGVEKNRPVRVRVDP